MIKKAMITPFSTLLNSLRFPSIFFWYFGTFIMREVTEEER